jgi:hypothetical protein
LVGKLPTRTIPLIDAMTVTVEAFCLDLPFPPPPLRLR